MKLLDKLIKEIELIPGVSTETSPVGGGYCVVYKGKEFGHFHNAQEIDLRLTKKLILENGLEHPNDSLFHPSRSKNSPWIELRYTNTQEVKRVAKYVKLASTVIKLFLCRIG